VVRGAAPGRPKRLRSGAAQGAGADRRRSGPARAAGEAGGFLPPAGALRGRAGGHRRLPARLRAGDPGSALGRLQGQGPPPGRPPPGGRHPRLSGPGAAGSGRAGRRRVPCADRAVQSHDRGRAGRRPRAGSGGAGLRRLSFPGCHPEPRRPGLAASGGPGAGGPRRARRPGHPGAHPDPARVRGAAAGGDLRPLGGGGVHRPGAPGPLRRAWGRLPRSRRRGPAPGGGPGDP
jgi:hypothetical protein